MSLSCSSVLRKEARDSEFMSAAGNDLCRLSLDRREILAQTSGFDKGAQQVPGQYRFLIRSLLCCRCGDSRDMKEKLGSIPQTKIKKVKIRRWPRGKITCCYCITLGFVPSICMPANSHPQLQSFTQ